MDIGPRLHGHQEGYVIHASGQVRHQVADPAPTLAVLPQRDRRFKHLTRFTRRGLDPHTRTRIEGLARPTEQLRFVIEEVHLAGPAIHEQLDHSLGSGPVVRTVPHGLRIQAGSVVAGQELTQSNTSKTSP